MKNSANRSPLSWVRAEPGLASAPAFANGRLIFYAPNVHTGGGLTLLRVLMEEWPEGHTCTALLDRRAASSLPVPADWTVIWCDRTLAGAVAAEIAARKHVRPEDVVFSFNSLAPILAHPAHTVVYLHNVYLLGDGPKVRGWVALRHFIERQIFSLVQPRVDVFWVQTPSMRRALERVLRARSSKARIEIVPFSRPVPSAASSDLTTGSWDFLYVSDGAPHKNHGSLLEAWKLLAQANVRPSLALTLGSRDELLWAQISRDAAHYGLRIENLGHLTHEGVAASYRASGALLFASSTETFGLPLIEAASFGLPILAAEADFVRDVCRPTQTFDPMSPVSIARAVRRHLGVDEKPVDLTPAGAVARRIYELAAAG